MRLGCLYNNPKICLYNNPKLQLEKTVDFRNELQLQKIGLCIFRLLFVKAVRFVKDGIAIAIPCMCQSLFQIRCWFDLVLRRFVPLWAKKTVANRGL